MMALFASWKLWALSAFSKPLAQAIAVGIASAVVVGGIGLGLLWLRNDARRDERAQMQLQQKIAQAAEEKKLREREQAATLQAAMLRAHFEGELEAAREAVAAMEKKLAERQRVVAYPKSIIPELNR
jgi:flagellar motor protein MotB